MLHLEKIDYRNVWDVIDLGAVGVRPPFVPENAISLAQAYAVIGSGTSAFPFGVYEDKTAVGFLMVGFNEAATYPGDLTPPSALRGNYSIWRLMIAPEYRGMGFGRAAMQLALDFIRTWPCGKAALCALTYHPENEAAAKLSRSVGFVENGERDGDEIVAVREL